MQVKPRFQKKNAGPLIRNSHTGFINVMMVNQPPVQKWKEYQTSSSTPVNPDIDVLSNNIHFEFNGGTFVIPQKVIFSVRKITHIFFRFYINTTLGV